MIIDYEGKEILFDNCILDTGSAGTAIDIDLIEFNYKRPAVIKRLRGIGGGTQEVIAQEVDKIILDDKPIKNIEIEFGDLQADLGINGFIGTDILKHFDITINFSKKNKEYLHLVEDGLATIPSFFPIRI